MADPPPSPHSSAPESMRMSDFEALMWELERSPMLSNAFANVTVFDRLPDPDRFRSRMAQAVERVPRLHQRAVPAPGRLATPEWVDDPDFDLDHHLKWVSLGGGDLSDLWDLVATLIRQPFDRGRPLWEFVVIEGIADGRAAMLQRMHHTITDGEGGVRLSVEFLDFTREPEQGGDAAADTIADTAAIADHGAAHADAEADSGRRLGDAARALGHTVRHRGGQLAGMLGSAGGAVRHPGDAAEVARSAARQVMVPSRCSPLWTERSLQRWFGTSQLDLPATKAAAHRLGGSVNDFFVTGATAGAAAYHLRHGAPVEHLRVSMPVSTRVKGDTTAAPDGHTAGGNAFAPTQTLVPAGPMPAAQRFEQIHDALAATKSEKALGAIDSAAAVVNFLPSAALVAAGERLTGAVDFVCSNVKAAPFELYIAGALIEANYPIGPLAGTAFNLTTMSYRGTLFLGLVVDPVAIAHPDELLADIDAAYAELFRAAT